MKSKILSIVTLLLSAMFILFSGCLRDTPKEISGMIYIPEGTFTIGTEEVDTNLLGKEFGTREEKLFVNGKPVRKIFLKNFYIDKFEVTNKDYKRFITQTGYDSPPNWEDGGYPEDRDTHPVNAVSWFDSNEYCKWIGKRLPAEEEWEKAARGPDGNKYPWGNEYDKNKANLSKKDTVPVGAMNEDKSYYGVYDMAGNLTEWTNSWYKPYPGSKLQSKYFGEMYKVVRGSSGNVVGHYILSAFESQSSFREFYTQQGKGIDVGFRCAKD